MFKIIDKCCITLFLTLSYLISFCLVHRLSLVGLLFISIYFFLLPLFPSFKLSCENFVAIVWFPSIASVWLLFPLPMAYSSKVRTTLTCCSFGSD
ncbi:hypothetical protein O6P43_023675 [Quillaja saponaria]|uniref:Uncharacterized protein n=1 Tax=Quillaja saponaria TaxID=32244 RepID=A0AAD7PJ05_QUISA|nr:hypothetical protein O6P43_023675 [Quillaja saponaria]